MVEESWGTGQQDHHLWNWQGKEHDKLSHRLWGVIARLGCSAASGDRAEGASVSERPGEDLARPALWTEPRPDLLGP